MLSATEVVRSFFERIQDRDWDAAAQLMAESARIRFTETGEEFTGANFVAMNKAYPEGWTIEVVEVLATDDRVAAQVRVTMPDEAFWCAGFYTVTGGQITDGTEHWVTANSQPPPPWRHLFTT